MSAQDPAQLPIEAQLQYRIMREEVRGATNMAELQKVSLKLIDLMELQRQTFLTMIKQQQTQQQQIGQRLLPQPRRPAQG
jgi:hypothetical protein